MLPWTSTVVPRLPGNGLEVTLWDTATRQYRQPLAPGASARLYVCGITPYDATHIGHATTYLAFDLLGRAWRDAGHPVRYVQNLTDVDDPLLERATATQVDWQQLANLEARRFRDDLTALRVLAPDAWVSVSEAMPEIVAEIVKLQEAGTVYQVDQDWYFDVSQVDDFGAVSGLSLAEMLPISAERGGDPDRPGKRNQLDALLWRGERAGEPAWPSPFGPGRPGWHVECLAIAKSHLAGPATVQGGGFDLVFPHHDYCLAESAAAGERYAELFAHVGMVSYQGAKMSKSLGNLVFVSKLREAGVDPMAIRTAILGNHYRTAWEWTDSHIKRADLRLEHWRQALACQGGADSLALLADVRRALADDLDSPKAMALVDDWASRTLAGDDSDPTAQGLVARTIDALLGIAL